MSISRNRLISKILDKDTGLVKSSLSDSDQIVSSGNKGIESTSAGTAVYATLANLPGSASTGDQAFVSSNNGLYIYNGSGWYKVALVNATPYWDTEASASYTFTIDTAITITLLAGDSDGHLITYTATPDSDANTFITITKDSDNGRIFTLTPDSENEAPSNSNSGTVTFKASDGISFASTVSTFTLNFSNIITNSAETVLLMKAAGNSATNAAITYQNSSDVSTGFTEAGTPQASTLSPYRSGGYSTYFDGSGDYLSIADNDTLEFGSGDFTVEAWVWPTAIDSSFSVIVNRWDSTSLKSYIVALTSTAVYFYYSTTGSNQTLLQWSETVPLNEWTHLAVVRNGNDLKLYVNGTAHATTNSMSGVTLYGGTSVTKVGILGDLNATTDFTGYIRDLRLIKGTAQYTSDFTAPTEALTAVSGTSLLICHLPYVSDGSTNDHSVTINGNVSTNPFGPYDYEPWAADNHGGSVFFDGTGDYLTTAASTDYDLSGDVTVECWARLDASASGNQTFWSLSEGNSDGYTIGYLRANVTPDQMAISTVGVAGLYAQGNMDHKEVWYHMAWVKQGTPSGDDEETRMYFNGKRILNSNGTSIWNAPTTPTLTIGTNYQSTPSPTYGYIADFHWTNSAKYTGSTYTVPTSPVSADANTKVLMNNKSDANIYDAAAANYLSLSGDAQSNTSTRKFSTSSSVYFDGTGDEIRIPDGVWKSFGTGDWTIEGWIYPTSGSSAYAWGDIASSGQNSSGSHFLLWSTTGITSYNYAGGNVTLTGSEATALNTWHHIATTREGNTFRLFVNGVLDASSTSSNAMNDSSVDYAIGSVGDYNSKFTGYIQDFRVTKGLARYTASFTPPTAEFDL